jgi:hypothetical protein
LLLQGHETCKQGVSLFHSNVTDSERRDLVTSHAEVDEADYGILLIVPISHHVIFGVSDTSRTSSKGSSLMDQRQSEQKSKKSETSVLLNRLSCSMNGKTVRNDASMQKANISKVTNLLLTSYWGMETS